MTTWHDQMVERSDPAWEHELPLELDVWLPLVGRTFAVTTGDGTAFELVLTSAEATPYGDPASYADRRLPFSLVFRAADGTHVPQQTCRFVTAEGSGADLFVVPLGRTAEGTTYEAVIS